MRSHPALRWPAARYRWSGRAGRSRTHDSQLGSNAQLVWTFTKRARRTELILNIITPIYRLPSDPFMLLIRAKIIMRITYAIQLQIYLPKMNFTCRYHVRRTIVNTGYCNSGFPKVGFVNPWRFVRGLQGVRQVTFIYIALLTIQIVTMHSTISKSIL